MGGFVLPRPPVFSPLTPPQIFSRERRLEAIFNKLTMPLLAPIYGWFTEGFDTADLQEAKALLETWAG